MTLFDSCPGSGTFKRSVVALTSSLPSSPPLRAMLIVLIYILVSFSWIIYVTLAIPDPIERIRQALNDTELMDGEAMRCYIYSYADPMVDWRVVKAHARDAVRRGFDVRREQLEESGHCAHVRVGGGTKYWAIVNDMSQASHK